MADDIVADFMSILADNLTAEELKSTEQILRSRWGGSRTYVCKAPSIHKYWRLREHTSAGFTVEEAAHMVGCTNRQAYRLRKRFQYA